MNKDSPTSLYLTILIISLVAMGLNSLLTRCSDPSKFTDVSDAVEQNNR